MRQGKTPMRISAELQAASSHVKEASQSIVAKAASTFGYEPQNALLAEQTAPTSRKVGTQTKENVPSDTKVMPEVHYLATNSKNCIGQIRRTLLD